MAWKGLASRAGQGKAILGKDCKKMMSVFQMRRVRLEMALWWWWWRVYLGVRRSSAYTLSQVRHGYTLEVHIGPFNAAFSVFGRRFRRTRERERVQDIDREVMCGT